MKVLVVGANRNTNKKGEEMYILDVVKNSARTFGKSTEQIFIKDSSPLFNEFVGLGSPQNLVGYFLNVDRNSSGFLEDLQILEKDENAVVWGF